MAVIDHGLFISEIVSTVRLAATEVMKGESNGSRQWDNDSFCSFSAFWEVKGDVRRKSFFDPDERCLRYKVVACSKNKLVYGHLCLIWDRTNLC